MFPGVQERLTAEMYKLAPPGVKVSVVAPPERRYSVWIGRSILGSLSSCEWITREEYDEVIQLLQRSTTSRLFFAHFRSDPCVLAGRVCLRGVCACGACVLRLACEWLFITYLADAMQRRLVLVHELSNQGRTTLSSTVRVSVSVSVSVSVCEREGTTHQMEDRMASTQHII